MNYKQYLEFIRYALNPKGEMPEGVAKMDWEGFFQFADEQGIVGVLFQGVTHQIENGKLKIENYGHTDSTDHTDLESGRPDYDLMLEWGYLAQVIEQQNKAVNVAAVKLLKGLKEKGFEGCVLKGQGNSLMYPKPYRRTPGDIDVWVKRQNNDERQSNRLTGYFRQKDIRTEIKEIIGFVKEENPEARAVYHHIDGGEIGGVKVEVHYRPSFMNSPIYNRRLQRGFEQKAPEQFGHEVELPATDDTDEHRAIDGHRICVPTGEFNVVYQLVHILRHLLQEGIGLRQIIDYYYLLRQSNDERQSNRLTGFFGQKNIRTEIRETLWYLGLEKIAGAVMWVLSEVLGLEEKYLIAPKKERLGRVLLAEILNGGNFGQYDLDNIKADSQLKKNWQRMKRDFRMMRYFPSECLWEPVFRVYHFLWRLRYN